MNNKMIRIDFVGPPGSGKTSVLRHFIANAKMKSTLSLSDAKFEVLDKNFNEENKEITKQIKSFIIKKIFKNISSHDKFKLRSFYVKTMFDHKIILELILKNIATRNSNIEYLHFKRINWLVEILESTLLVSEFINDKIVLCDESLSSKLFQNDFGLSYKDIPNNLKDSLLPNAFIYFYCSEDTLYKRLKSRKKVTLQHTINNLNFDLQIKNSINEAENILENLLNLDVPYLRLDANNNLDDNISRIKKFIENKFRI